MSIQKDYIERILERLVAALASLLLGARGHTPEEARQQLEQTGGELLGLDYRVVRMMEPALAAQVLGHPAKVEVLARLVAVEAEVHVHDGSPAAAARCLTEALALLDQADARRTGPSAESRTWRAEWEARRRQLAPPA
jgi:hypothetical protein